MRTVLAVLYWLETSPVMKSNARFVMGALNSIWNELHQVLGYRKFPEKEGGAPMTDDWRV